MIIGGNTMTMRVSVVSFSGKVGCAMWGWEGVQEKGSITLTFEGMSLRCKKTTDSM